MPALSVTENRLARRLVRQANPIIHWGTAHREARSILVESGLDIDPRLPVTDFMPVERALVAIIRAFMEIAEAAGGKGGLLILDEPTPFLSRVDVERLFALVRTLAKQGTSVIFVSHDVDEVKELTARATVLRIAASLVTAEASKADFIAAIVGRHLASERSKGAKPSGETMIDLSGLSTADLAPMEMMEQGYGRIINTASQLAHKPAAGAAIYSAAKAGVVALTSAVAQEVAAHGVLVNCVCPGPTDTATWRESPADWRKWKEAQLPIRRIAHPDEIASAYVYLASDEASFMVGQSISPNGGDVTW